MRWAGRKLEAHYARLDKHGYRTLKDSTTAPETKKEKIQVEKYVKNFHTIQKLYCDETGKCKLVK